MSRSPRRFHLRGALILKGLLLMLAFLPACFLQQAGDKGEILFAYQEEDLSLQFNRPMATGSTLTFSVHEISVSQEDLIIDKVHVTPELELQDFGVNLIEIKAQQEGDGRITVEAHTRKGKKVRDTIGVRVRKRAHTKAALVPVDPERQTYQTLAGAPILVEVTYYSKEGEELVGRLEPPKPTADWIRYTQTSPYRNRLVEVIPHPDRVGAQELTFDGILKPLPLILVAESELDEIQPPPGLLPHRQPLTVEGYRFDAHFWLWANKNKVFNTEALMREAKSLTPEICAVSPAEVGKDALTASHILGDKSPALFEHLDFRQGLERAWLLNKSPHALLVNLQQILEAKSVYTVRFQALKSGVCKYQVSYGSLSWKGSLDVARLVVDGKGGKDSLEIKGPRIPETVTVPTLPFVLALIGFILLLTVVVLKAVRAIKKDLD